MSLRTIPITIELPVKAIADAVGPDIIRAMRLDGKQRAAEALQRPPVTALINAAGKLSVALSKYEQSQHGHDRQRALVHLIAASKGVQSVLHAMKNSQEGH